MDLFSPSPWVIILLLLLIYVPIVFIISRSENKIIFLGVSKRLILCLPDGGLLVVGELVPDVVCRPRHPVPSHGPVSRICVARAERLSKLIMNYLEHQVCCMWYWSCPEIAAAVTPGAAVSPGFEGQAAVVVTLQLVTGGEVAREVTWEVAREDIWEDSIILSKEVTVTCHGEASDLPRSDS